MNKSSQNASVHSAEIIRTEDRGPVKKIHIVHITPNLTFAFTEDFPECMEATKGKVILLLFLTIFPSVSKSVCEEQPYIYLDF